MISDNNQKEFTDSNELSYLLNIDPSLIRRDLSLIGKIGKRGMGYSINALKSGIENILGKNKIWKLALIGIGNLGRAILRYILNNTSSNYSVVKLYDNDPAKIGISIEGIDIKNFDTINKHIDFNIGLITVPADSAQAIADKLVDCNIKAIMNFAPIKLSLPNDIFYREVDLIKELDILTGMLNFNNAIQKSS
jgi:redox-sensing transcriptional repressor